MNTGINPFLLLSLLQGQSAGVRRAPSFSTPSSNGLGNNGLLIALLLGGGGLGNDLFGSLGSLFGGNTATEPSGAITEFPDIPITPAPTPVAPTPANDTLELTAKTGTLPLGFDPKNPTPYITYDGRQYKFTKAIKNKQGVITNLQYKSPKKLRLGLNYINLKITPNSSSSSSLSSLLNYSLRRGSPLVFDLNGDGKTKTLETTRQFDIDNDGQLDTINNIDEGDGLLVMGDGADATKVFGNHTLGQKFDNGFDALQSVAQSSLGDEAVADGKLDATEIKALEAKIGLGMKVDGQVKTLSELGITSINLKYNDKIESIDERGNVHAGRSAFVQNGQNKRIHDIFFKIH